MKVKAIPSKNPQDWGEFKWLRNKVNSNIKITKESYYKIIYWTQKRLTAHLANYKRTYIPQK